jgi:polyvinyl alcohol dehydrogenase (cytochrome)
MSMLMTKSQTPRTLGLIVLGALGCAVDPQGPGGQRQLPTGGGGAAAAAAAGAFAPGLGAGGAAAQPVAGGQPGVIAGAGGDGSVVPPMGGTAGTSGGVPTVEVRSNWSSFGGDLAHSRYSASETMISTSNVKDLKPAFDIKAPGVTATPALYQGVIYWSDWGGVVHATNLADQRELWRVDKSAMGGGYTGSPAVTATAVYVANRNGLLSALDRETGGVLWEETLDAGVHTHIWSSPVVAEQDNVLVVGVGGLGTRDNGIALPSSQLETFRGWVEGRDATTGAHLWRFDVTAQPNGAGVSVWSSAALDTTRKLAFIGTGNNYYRPVSAYSDSLLAIDYMTGTYKWHAQFTANDAWTVGTVLSGGVDGDVGATPNLFSIDGRDVVGVGDKPGDYHVHDRETGAELWMTPLTNGSGFQGGVMAPAAYHDGVIYVVSNNGTSSSTAFALAATSGAILWETNLTDPTFGGPALGNGVLYVGDQAGNAWALDAASGGKLWETRLPAGRGGGFSLVDGMLFTGYGFHFSESRQEPLMGGLLAYSLTGSIPPPPAGEATDDCIPGTALTTEPTFTNVYQGVLCPSGCTKVCHSSSGEAGLRLHQKAMAHQTMVGVAAKGPACSTGGHMLVVAGDPTMSLLYGKLALTPACGVSMPPAATAATTPVTPAMLDVLRAWIAAGAPNN